MFGSAILDVVVGLAFLYLLLSIVCSTINEWIAGVLKLRAKTLREGIENLLDDPYAPGLLERFLDNPLIKGLSRKGESSFPSYIPAKTFALALLNTIARTDQDVSPPSIADSYRRTRDRLAELSKSNSELARSLVVLIDRAGGDPAKVEQAAITLQQLERSRQQIVEQLTAVTGAASSAGFAPELLDRLKGVDALLKQADDEVQGAVERAQTSIESYFNEAMERVSGWYKRRAQVIIVIIAATVTILLNADSIAVANRLVSSPELRASVVAAATDFVQSQAPTSDNQASPAGSDTDTTAMLTPRLTYTETLAILDRLDLPIGWRPELTPTSIDDWFYKIVGLLVTTIAVSLGAPFWFYLLNKLINLRMSGSKPATKT